MNKKTCILSPAYNVQNEIENFIRSSVNISNFVFIVDDGSTDGTRDILERVNSEFRNIRIIHKQKNQGKAKALLAGLTYITKAYPDIEFIIQMDSDLAHSTNDLNSFFKMKNQADLIVGNRYGYDRKIDTHRANVIKLASRTIKYATNYSLTDPMCGFRVYNRKAGMVFANRICSHGYGIETEQLIQCKLNGFEVRETNLKNVISQDKKTKAIEFIDVFETLLYYSNYLNFTDHIIDKITTAVNNLKKRRNFRYDFADFEISFTYSNYGDSYILSSAK